MAGSSRSTPEVSKSSLYFFLRFRPPISASRRRTAGEGSAERRSRGASLDIQRSNEMNCLKMNSPSRTPIGRIKTNPPDAQQPSIEQNGQIARKASPNRIKIVLPAPVHFGSGFRPSAMQVREEAQRTSLRCFVRFARDFFILSGAICFCCMSMRLNGSNKRPRALLPQAVCFCIQAAEYVWLLDSGILVIGLPLFLVHASWGHSRTGSQSDSPGQSQIFKSLAISWSIQL